MEGRHRQGPPADRGRERRPLTAQTLWRGVRALTDPDRPILAQIVVTRRCNLSCGYCNEYDHVSHPVPAARIEEYLDHLARLGTAVVTFTGGEPLLHPELDRLVATAVDRHMFCTIITNGYPLTRDWIERLNRAGLYLLQVSVDNLDPNPVSQKSLNLIKKLPLLRAHARFRVNINAVLGSGPLEETRELVRQVQRMGFYMTMGLVHNGYGTLDRGLLKQADLEVLHAEMNGHRRRFWGHWLGEGWEDDMVRTGVSDWKCRAGARYLYIDELGVVSLCSQRRGEPGLPLLDYGRDQIRRFARARKGCEPSCTIACVRRASAVDRHRAQTESLRPQTVPKPIRVLPGALAPNVP